ncbi:MAG: Na+/H+ antiporter subunit E [Nitratireductor sp.]
MMLFFINVLLSLAWAAVTGSFSEINLAFGFALAMFALWLIREQVGTTGYFRRIQKVTSLALLFLYELLMSAVKVFLLVIKPRLDVKPGIFAYPLKVDRDFEITLLANLITLTPGTLSVDVSHDRRYLFVHALDCSDPESTKRDIASGFERKIMEAFR